MADRNLKTSQPEHLNRIYFLRGVPDPNTANQ